MEYLKGERCGNLLLNSIIEWSGGKEKNKRQSCSVLSEYNYGTSKGKGYGYRVKYYLLCWKAMKV